MKKLLRMLAMLILMPIIVVASPVNASGKFLYQSDLDDNPAPDYPAVLTSGQVTIDSSFVVRIRIKTDTPDQTYAVFMQVGPVQRRANIILGTITTDDVGQCKAEFDLKDYDPQISTPRIIGPYFAILSPSKPLPEFDTSYPAFPNASPPEPGKIILMAGAPDSPNTNFALDLSYGYDNGYPAGVSLKEGEQIGDAISLAPGIYTVSERYQAGWNVPGIMISDPTFDSFPSGKFTVIVNVAPGETVTIRFKNTPQS